MTVLARELDAYKRAVEQYNRQTRGYNKSVEQYNNTIVTDANGNAIVRDSSGNTYSVDKEGRLSGYTLPSGQSVADYGSTALPDSPYQMMRQNPTTRNVETVTGATLRQGGSEESPVVGYGDANGNLYGPEWRMVSQNYQGGDESPYYTYTLQRDASVYADKPGAFDKTQPKQPDPSMAAVRRMYRPGLAQQEAGLVGSVIRNNGLASAVGYRSGTGAPKITQQAPTADTTPVAPPPYVDPNNPYNQDLTPY